jgi:uncharacterized membrane protein
MMSLQPILQLVLVIVVVAIILWGLTQVPMDDTLRKIAWAVLIVAVAIYAVLVLFGMAGVTLK